MNLIDDITRVLRRPLSGDAGLGSSRRPKGAPVEEPVSEADLLAAIARCGNERETAEALIAGHGENREAMLTGGGKNSDIMALDREIDEANITLQRLDRIEPELRRRLSEMRELATRARWIAIRDAHVAACRRYAEALQAFMPHLAEMQAAHSTACNEFPYAPLPIFPVITAPTLEAFESEIAALDRVFYDGKRRGPALRSQSDILREDGVEAAEAFGGDIVPMHAREITLRMLVDDLSSPDQRAWVRRGSIRKVFPDEAREMIIRGEAEMIGVHVEGIRASVR